MGEVVPTRTIPRREVLLQQAGDTPLTTLEFLELLSFWMDRCFTVPGTSFRFGVNSLLLLVPGLGDTVAGLVSFLILSIGLSHYRVPRIVAVRMVLHSVLDTTLSAIPVVGNLWDVFFKADTRNIRLLQEYIGRSEPTPPSTWRHWLFVIGLLGLVAITLFLVALGVVALVTLLVQGLRQPPVA